MTTTIEELAAVTRELNHDEQQVLLVIAQRIRAGRWVYGGLDLGADKRDMRKEANEELLDATVYLAMATAKDRRP